ncbi:hypothetical protein ACFQH6_17600 [Halobacteriaceae archaeon GCM10025711]
MEPVTPAEAAGDLAADPADLPPAERAVVQDADDGTATTYGHTPVANGTLVALDGSYAAVVVTEDGTEPVERWLLGAEPVDDSPEEPGTWDDVPRDARRTVREAIVRGADRPADASLDDPDYLAVVRSFSATDAGLAPDPDPAYFTTSGMGTFRLFARRRTVEETVYRYRLEPVADSPAGVLEQHTVSLSPAGLPPEERAVVEEAIETGSYTEGYTGHGANPTSGAFQAVIDRVESATGRRASAGSPVVAYVRYDGTLYRATLDYESAE